MKESYQVETFKNILIEKGYDDHFVITVCHFGKLEENLNAFIKDYQSGGMDIANGLLTFTTYLQSNGIDKPSIKCDLYVDYKNGEFNATRMEILYRDSLKKTLEHVVMDVSMDTLPTAREAIAMVTDVALKETPIKKGIRFK